LLYPKAFFVVTQTASSASYFKNLTNLKVIPNAVFPISKSRKIYGNTIRRIVSVGRLCPFKGFDTLIRAFSYLHKEYPKSRLTIYGEGKERSKLEELIRSLGLQKKVFLPGTTQAIQEALLKADLFIFPSHYEGFPNALCEAMAAGLPVIASNCSGNIDIIRDGIDGRLFPVGNVEALTRIIRELLSDKAQCKRLAHNARAVCNRFHPNKVFKLWDELIARALSLSKTKSTS
jgi:glycosyltransferase involved in cell wall biosynthesis